MIPNMIGAYGEWAAQAMQDPARLSFRQPMFANVDAWRAVARARFSEMLMGPGGAIEIETTRPELVPACVALVAHPGDARYQSIIGTEVATRERQSSSWAWSAWANTRVN